MRTFFKSIRYTGAYCSAHALTVNPLAELRKNYAYGSLSETDVAADPIKQFQHWFSEAQRAQVPEPNAMSLASVDARGRPTSRIVLLKDADQEGFIFFTNYESAKARDLALHPYASLLFHWVELERQVRIEGSVEKVSDELSERYYHSRPLASRIGAWASEQSKVLDSRATLEARESAFSARFGDNPPRPAYWGGYRVKPDAMEFWQGRPSRLHDRIKYIAIEQDWRIFRLSP